jgi:CO/xanthine dehydrogenase Mo-binding subunit
VTSRTRSLIGQRVLRREDLRFVSGIGQFVDDLSPADVLHGFTVRSPWSHGKNLHIEAETARRMPGVHLILTADDLVQAGRQVTASIHGPHRRSRFWRETR